MALKRRTPHYGSEESRQLMAAYPPIDLHADTLMWSRWIGYDIRKRHRAILPKSSWVGHVDIPRLANGLVGAQFFGLVSLPIRSQRCAPILEDQIDCLDDVCRTSDHLVKATNAEDVERANRDDKIAALLGIEGAHALDGDIANIERFAKRGVRYLGLAHFSANDACTPAKGRGARQDTGLSPFGIDAIAACEANGVILDLTHINRKGFTESCALSRKPVIVSHTGIHRAYPHWRNLEDDQLRLVAESGGVIGIMFAPKFLGGADIDAVIRHMQCAIDIVGDDHLALGSDYDGMIVPTQGLSDISMLPNLTNAMLRAGWKPERIGKIMRGNVLRVLRDAPSRTT